MWLSGPIHPLFRLFGIVFLPQETDIAAIVTLVGGTVGGYISFAGAHRLLDAGIKGQAALPQVTRSSVTAILVAGVMRILLFLAALGVVMTGATLDAGNPPAAVFRIAAGTVGYTMFGMVLWCAAITSVVGSAYTSVSFLRGLHPLIDKHAKTATFLFIIVSTLIFIVAGRAPVPLLIVAGTVNGFILPVALALLLLAASQQRITGSYQHPRWMYVAGWLVIGVMGTMATKVALGW